MSDGPAGFKPSTHIAPEGSPAAAHVYSVNYPRSYLRLTKAGVDWAEKLMEERLFFKQSWTIERQQ